MLTPRASSSREYLRLDGLWRFRFDTGEAGSGTGTAQRWWRAPLPGTREMPVPASYNDLVTDPAEREHVGDVWYQREVWVPASWAGRRIVLRCDAVTHRGPCGPVTRRSPSTPVVTLRSRLTSPRWPGAVSRSA